MVELFIGKNWPVLKKIINYNSILWNKHIEAFCSCVDRVNSVQKIMDEHHLNHWRDAWWNYSLVKIDQCWRKLSTIIQYCGLKEVTHGISWTSSGSLNHTIFLFKWDNRKSDIKMGPYLGVVSMQCISLNVNCRAIIPLKPKYIHIYIYISLHVIE